MKTTIGLPDYALYNEKELLLRVAEGDEDAYRELFRHYWPKVYSIALLFVKAPEPAEDAAQEVFARLWIKRALLTDVKEFQAYLVTTARNLIFNKLRNQLSTSQYTTWLQEYFADTMADPAATLEFKEASQVIEAGIRQLTPQQEKVFRLSRFQGMSHAEIAQATGLSRRTVKNYMVSAILSLRNYLDQYSGSVLILFWASIFL